MKEVKIERTCYKMEPYDRAEIQYSEVFGEELLTLGVLTLILNSDCPRQIIKNLRDSLTKILEET